MGTGSRYGLLATRFLVPAPVRLGGNGRFLPLGDEASSMS